MNQLDEQKLTTLIEERAESIDSNQYYLSVYHPKQNSELDLKKKVKSAVLTCLRESEELSDQSHLHKQILDTVIEEINTLLDMKEGIAVFISFDSSQSKRADFPEKLKDALHLFTLDEKPIEECYLGKIYKLDQLICLSHYQRKSLVLSLNQKKSELYSLDTTEMSLIRTFDNDFINEQENEYLDKYSPTKSDGTYYSTGSDVTDRRNEKDNELFMSEIITYLENYYQNKRKFNFIICFYSEQFKNLITTFENKFNNKHQIKKIITIQNNFNIKSSLEVESRDSISEFEGEEKKKSIEEFEEKKLIQYGWAKILSAARQGKIEQLFIRQKITHSGYILGNQQPYSHSVKDSKKVSDIVPWLINQVAQNGGMVTCLSAENEVLAEHNVGAVLRY